MTEIARWSTLEDAHAALDKYSAEIEHLRAALNLALMHLEDPRAIAAVRAALAGGEHEAPEEAPQEGAGHGAQSKNHGWVISGWDTSSSGIAGAAIAFDKTLGKIKGPEFFVRRWGKEYHYYDRLRDSARSHEMMLALEHELGIFSMNMGEIYIAQEEPWPLGMVTGKLSNALKQQAEMSGAFLGGLVRYGFENIVQMNSMTWRSMVAQQLGITTHHSKWKDPALCEIL